jgi:hypothetical protein
MSIDLVQSSDPRFATLNKSRNNGRFPEPGQSVAQIALCQTGADVAEAVGQAVKAGNRPTIMSGGHCYEGFVLNNPGGTIINVHNMNGVTQDPSTKRWKIEGGATMADMYLGMYNGGKVTIPSTSCTTVGVGGAISGGSYGFLTRLYGISPDWISAVEVVTVDAKGNPHLMIVDKKHDSDLFRALRGSGGGSYGVVTAFYSDNPPPAPEQVLTGHLSFEWTGMTPERLHRILWLYSNYFNTRGRDKETWGLFTIMNMSPGNAAQGRNPNIGMSVMFTNLDGTVKDTKVLDEFFEMFDECKPISQLAHHPNSPGAEHLPDPGGPGEIVCLATHNVMQRSWIDFSGANRQPGQRPGGANAQRPNAQRPASSQQSRFNRGPGRQNYKSAYMKSPYTIEEARVFFKHLTDTDPQGGSSIAMDSFGGAASKQEMLEETSDCHRSAIMKMQFNLGWSDAAEDQARMGHMNQFYKDLFSASSDGKHAGTPYFNDHTEGCYINYCDVDMLQYSYWPQLYWGTGKLFPFLQHVKKKYDPNNIFHHAMSVKA